MGLTAGIGTPGLALQVSQGWQLPWGPVILRLTSHPVACVAPGLGAGTCSIIVRPCPVGDGHCAGTPVDTSACLRVAAALQSNNFSGVCDHEVTTCEVQGHRPPQ